MFPNSKSIETDPDLSLIETSTKSLECWVRLENYKGWDPFDALNSRLLNVLTFQNRKLGQLWVQFFKLSPINFRPILRVPKGYNPKGISLFLIAYLRQFQTFGRIEDLHHSQFFADWLCDHISPGYHGACWGYNFDWPNRSGFIKAGVPTVVNSSFIGLSLLELIKQLRKEKLPHDRYLKVALDICQFILLDLNFKLEDNREICFSYNPYDHSKVHNANLLAAQFLAEVYAEVENEELKEYSLLSTRFSVNRQLSDGSWFYGEEKKNHWIDNFHTGFVLVSLKRIGECLETNEFDFAIQNGYSFWKENMFIDTYLPKYYLEQLFPIDIHCVAQSILTFLVYRDLDHEGPIFAKKIATWAVEHLQNPQGFFYYRMNRSYINKIPYIRWSQAWMFRALTELLFAYKSFPLI